MSVCYPPTNLGDPRGEVKLATLPGTGTRTAQPA